MPPRHPPQPDADLDAEYARRDRERQDALEKCRCILERCASEFDDLIGKILRNAPERGPNPQISPVSAALAGQPAEIRRTTKVEFDRVELVWYLSNRGMFRFILYLEARNIRIHCAGINRVQNGDLFAMFREATADNPLVTYHQGARDIPFARLPRSSVVKPD
ncbi:hypothetical protein KBC70_02840 [Candidatus Woesebacteria bacterium]|nr:hypothetical protein [Candidatus Woesebacteria bacterium]